MKGGVRMQDEGRKLRILMMIHRQADNSPYCFYVHDQAKALMARGHEVVVISCVGVTPMMSRLRPKQAQVARQTPKEATVDGVRVFYPRCLTLGNAGEKLLGGRLLARAALPIARRLHAKKPFDIVHAHSPFSSGLEAMRIAKKLNVPLVATFHSKFYDDAMKITHSKMISRTGVNTIVDFFNKCDAVWAVNDGTAKVLREYGFGGKITVMENGYE